MKIKIGHLTYEVKQIDAELMNAKNLFGQCDREKQIITIAEGLPKERYAEVLLHECLHGIFEIKGLEFEHELEERIVNAFAMGITELFQRNSDLLHLFEGE